MSRLLAWYCISHPRPSQTGQCQHATRPITLHRVSTLPQNVVKTAHNQHNQHQPKYCTHTGFYRARKSRLLRLVLLWNNNTLQSCDNGQFRLIVAATGTMRLPSSRRGVDSRQLFPDFYEGENTSQTTQPSSLEADNQQLLAPSAL